MDETKDKDGRHVAAVIVRDFEDPSSPPYLIYTVELEFTNGETVKAAVDDAIRKLGENTDRRNILVLVTDAARYMKKAGMYHYSIYMQILQRNNARKYIMRKRKFARIP